MLIMVMTAGLGANILSDICQTVLMMRDLMSVQGLAKTQC